MDLLHKVLAAPGGLLVTSTKLDLFLLTARARERSGSPVQVLDLTGAVNWPAGPLEPHPRLHHRQDRETPRPGPAPRHRRRHQPTARGNHAFFERRAVDVMTAYLLAAALSRATLAEFVGWCQNDLDTEAATILRDYPEFAAVRRTLQQAQAVVEETRSGIWETLRDAIACLTDPEVVASALPAPRSPGSTRRASSSDRRHHLRDRVRGRCRRSGAADHRLRPGGSRQRPPPSHRRQPRHPAANG